MLQAPVASTPELGPALRQLRRRQGHSLLDVADATGISRSFLSLVENGRSDITIGRLLRLVAFYGAQISDLLPQPEQEDPIVVRRGDQREVRSPAEGIRISLLAPHVERKMSPSLGVVEPTGASAEYASHPGEEFIYVLEGSITLAFADAEPIVLGEGDSAYFKSERPHSYRNEGKHLARFLSVSTPPT
jgi:transcriptional regulator with XRE-family HTH domain